MRKCDQQIFTIDLVPTFGHVSDIRGRGSTQIENAEARFRPPMTGEFAESARTTRQSLRCLGRFRRLARFSRRATTEQFHEVCVTEAIVYSWPPALLGSASSGAYDVLARGFCATIFSVPQQLALKFRN